MREGQPCQSDAAEKAHVESYTRKCNLQSSLAMPDMHSGYGFAIGNVAAFDMDDDRAVVSPGGVGFDINCGVRLIRTNLVRPSS